MKLKEGISQARGNIGTGGFNFSPSFEINEHKGKAKKERSNMEKMLGI